MSENETSKKVDEAAAEMVSEGGVPEAEREALPAEEALEAAADEAEASEVDGASEAASDTDTAADAVDAGAAASEGDVSHADLVAQADVAAAEAGNGEDDEEERLRAQGLEKDYVPNGQILAVVFVLTVGLMVIGGAMFQITRYVAQSEVRERYASVVDPELLEVRERNRDRLDVFSHDEESGEYRTDITTGKELLLANPQWISRHPLGTEATAREMRQDAAGADGTDPLEADVAPSTLEEEGAPSDDEETEAPSTDDRESGEAAPDAGDDAN